LISITSMIQIIIGFLGSTSAISVLWLANIYKWSSEIMMIVSLSIGIGTILIEVVISFTSLRNSIEKLYPALELSPEDQKEIHSLVALKNSLKKRIDKPHVLIALEQFKKVNAILKAAYNDSDFFVDNTFEANRLALESMEKGQIFLALWYFAG